MGVVSQSLAVHSGAATATEPLRFSLVLCTIGRVNELERFLQSLDAQSYRNFELLVVDQNPDERLAPVLAPYRQRFPMEHLRCGPGLARARNLGMSMAHGDVIAFPDDDCEYQPHLLADIARRFLDDPHLEGLTGRPVLDNYYHRRQGRVTKYNAWKRGIEYAIFLRQSLVQKTGRFDEQMGLGASTFWWGGEGTDFLLTSIARGCKVWYDPQITVSHPGPLTNGQLHEVYVQRAYCYALGKGRVLRKHRCPAWLCIGLVLRPLAGAAFSLLRFDVKQARVYSAASRGVLRGWRGHLC